jgi:hypothetical protein
MLARIASLALPFLLLPGAASAAGVNGSKPMLCALTEAVECQYETECTHGSVESMNFPPFVRIDAKAKTLTEHEGERKTTVQTVSERDGNLVLQGYENRAFSITISKATGRLTATATGPETGFVLFGICTQL